MARFRYWLDQSPPRCFCDGGGAGGLSQLRPDICDVAMNGVRAENKALSDLPIRKSLRDQGEDL